MNLTSNELQQIRSMYPQELSDVQILDPTPKLFEAFKLAKKCIVDFSKDATFPTFTEVYVSSEDLYTIFEGSKTLMTACPISLENKAIIIFSPSAVKNNNIVKITAALIHELIHAISQAELFMEWFDEEGITDLCSMTIQEKFLCSPEIPYYCEQYQDKIVEIEAYIKESGFSIEDVVREFLDNRTNRLFIKKNFPKIYKKSLIDVFENLFN